MRLYCLVEVSRVETGRLAVVGVASSRELLSLYVRQYALRLGRTTRRSGGNADAATGLPARLQLERVLHRTRIESQAHYGVGRGDDLMLRATVAEHQSSGTRVGRTGGWERRKQCVVSEDVVSGDALDRTEREDDAEHQAHLEDEEEDVLVPASIDFVGAVPIESKLCAYAPP